MVNRLPLYGSGGLARRGPSPGVLCRAVPGSWESAVGCASRPDSRAGMCNGAGHPTAGTKSHLIPPAPAARHNKPGPCLSFPHRGVLGGDPAEPPVRRSRGLAVLVAGLARVGGVKVRANPTRSGRQREGSGWEVILGGKRINPPDPRGGMTVAHGPRRVAAVPVTWDRRRNPGALS